jgi:hypothetical protein
MALTKIPASLLDTSGGLDLQGNITLGDSEKILLGDSSDLQIYHDESGGHSRIDDTGTGGLVIRGSQVLLEKYGGGYMINAVADGASELYHAGSKKFETSSDGATVTGNLAVTGDLNITGNVNSASVTDLDVTDKTITLGAGQTEALSGGSGIIIDGSGASLLWNETNSQFDFNTTVNVTSGNMKIDGNQVGLNHVAHGITSGNSVANKFQIGRWKGSTFDRWMLVPVNNGSEQYSDEFGYNFSTGAWFFDDKVGIGTTDPNAKLELNVASGDGLLIKSADVSTIKMKGSGGVTDWGFATTYQAAGDFGIYASNSAGGDPITAGTAKMYFTSAGDVGIADTSPTDKLVVAGALRLTANISFDSNKSGRIYKAINHGLAFHGVTGTENDFAMFNPAGQLMVVNPTGTNDVSLIPAASGKVGIGTDSPNSTVGKLDIAGSATNYNASPMITFRDTTGVADSRNWSIGNIAINYGDFHIGCGDSNSDYFDAASHSKFMINKDGNVGIGTVSPVATAQLTIGGTSRIAPVSGNGLLFASGGSDRMFLNTSGNLSIGNTNGNSTLDLTKTSDTGERAIRIENSSARLYVGVEGSSGNRFSGSSVNNGFIGTTTDDGLEFGTANVVRAVITNTGNVGIGNSSPSSLYWPNGSTGGLFLQAGGLLSAYNAGTNLSQNWYYNAGEKFIGNGGASRYVQSGQEHIWSHSTTVNSSGAGANLTWRESMRIDSSGNVGIAAIPSGEAASAHVVRLGDRVCISEYDDGQNPEQFNLFHNSDSSETYIETGYATNIQQRNGEITFKTAASGTAGAAITFNDRLKLYNNGMIGIPRVNVGALHNSAVGSYGSGPYSTTNTQVYTFTITSDNVWRVLFNDLRDTAGFMYVTLGDAASKDTASYTYNITSVPYGVSMFANLTYSDGGWNTGIFEFRITNNSPTYNLEVRFSSYYSTSNIAIGNIRFERLY